MEEHRIVSKYQMLLGHYVKVYPVFIDIAGDAVGGILLGQFFYWQPQSTGEGGWFQRSYDEIWEETRLNRKSIDRVRGNLRTLGILQEMRRGVPPQMYYRLDMDILDDMLDQYVDTGRQSLSPPMGIPDVTDCPNRTFLLREDKNKSKNKNKTKIREDKNKSKTKNEEYPSVISSDKQSLSPEMTSPHGGEVVFGEVKTQGENKRGKKAAPKGGPSYSESFEAFWAAYPRKVAKPKAWKAWQAQGCEEISADIITTLGSHPALTGDAKFIPHPATFLNQRRWEDASAAEPDAEEKARRKAEGEARWRRITAETEDWKRQQLSQATAELEAMSDAEREEIERLKREALARVDAKGVGRRTDDTGA